MPTIAYTLPVYTSLNPTTCVSTLSVSSTTGSFSSMASLLDNPVLSGTDNVVKPVDLSLA